MPNLLYKMFGDPEPEAEEAVVRPHAEVYDVDKEPAEAPAPPEPQLYESDPDPNLGLAGRTIASDWTQGERTAPVYGELATAEHNAIVNRQVATSGTAAGREASGQRGPGTLSYAVGIDPVIHDGSSFGNEYFEAGKRGIQDGAGEYMKPSAYDRDAVLAASTSGKENARDAGAAGMYRNWFANTQAGRM